MASFTKSYEVISSKGRRFTITDTHYVSDAYDGSPTPLPSGAEGGNSVGVTKDGSLNQWIRRKGAEPQ